MLIKPTPTFAKCHIHKFDKKLDISLDKNARDTSEVELLRKGGEWGEGKVREDNNEGDDGIIIYEDERSWLRLVFKTFNVFFGLGKFVENFSWHTQGLSTLFSSSREIEDKNKFM